MLIFLEEMVFDISMFSFFHFRVKIFERYVMIHGWANLQLCILTHSFDAEICFLSYCGRESFGGS